LKRSKASSNEWFTIFPNARFGELFGELFRVLKKNAHLYLFCDPETMFVAKPVAEASGFNFWKPLIWDKRRIGMGYHYRARYECILFFEKGKRRLADLGVSALSATNLRLECATALEVARHAPYRPLEHVTDLTGSQVRDLLPRKLCTGLMVGPVEKDHVKVRVTAQVRRRALHHRHCSRLGRISCHHRRRRPSNENGPSSVAFTFAMAR
jgi:hypothetical protein